MASRGKRDGDRLELVKDAAIQLAALTGRRPERVLGFDKGDDVWRISFELLEMQRLPRSTDLLGRYDVEVDDGGDLVRYERSHRYQRGQADGAGG